nr:head maturation protease, ClpP-related [Dietzia sp. CQ4]
MIYDVIGWWPNDAETLARELKALEVDEITVRINSPGGSAYDGFAIYNALRSHSATVTTVVEGLAASAASIIALAGDKVVMRPASELMIHEAWIATAGPAEELRKMADRLDKMNGTIAGIYAEQAGTPADMWREAMRVETWFTPDEALEAGLVDAVEDGKVAAGASNHAALPIFNFASRAAAPPPHITASSAQAEGKRKEGNVPTIQDKLRPLVGLADDSDDDTIVSAVSEALDERADGIDSDPGYGPLVAALGLEEDTDASEVLAAALTAVTTRTTVGEDDDVVTVDKARFDELVAAEAALGDYQGKDAQAEAERLVDEAIEDGRLAASSKDRWVTKILDDPEDAKPRLAQIAKARIPRSEIGRGEHADDQQNPDAAERQQLTQKARAAGYGRRRLV